MLWECPTPLLHPNLVIDSRKHRGRRNLFAWTATCWRRLLRRSLFCSMRPTPNRSETRIFSSTLSSLSRFYAELSLFCSFAFELILRLVAICNVHLFMPPTFSSCTVRIHHSWIEAPRRVEEPGFLLGVGSSGSVILGGGISEYSEQKLFYEPQVGVQRCVGTWTCCVLAFPPRGCQPFIPVSKISHDFGEHEALKPIAHNQNPIFDASSCVPKSC